MRVRAVCALLGTILASTATAHAARLLEPDDPKIARALPVVSKPPPRPTPRCKLGYRYLPMPSPAGGTLKFNGGSVDVYPISTYVRIGIGLEGGYGGGALTAFYAAGSVSMGLQYPAWVTPFVDGRFAVGGVFGSYAQTTMPSLLYIAGLDVGAELYIAKRFFTTIAIGWSRPMFKAPDVVAYEADPSAPVVMKKFQSDAFTLKVGLGF